MKSSDTSLKVVCPICWARPLERCEMNNGFLRFESHRERMYFAEDRDAQVNRRVHHRRSFVNACEVGFPVTCLYTRRESRSSQNRFGNGMLGSGA